MNWEALNASLRLHLQEKSWLWEEARLHPSPYMAAEHAQKSHLLDRQTHTSWGGGGLQCNMKALSKCAYLGSGRMIFLLARAAGVDLLFSIAIK